MALDGPAYREKFQLVGIAVVEVVLVAAFAMDTVRRRQATDSHGGLRRR